MSFTLQIVLFYDENSTEIVEQNFIVCLYNVANNDWLLR